MSISALVPIAHLLAANAALEAAGHGPSNFSIPCYAGPAATHAALHCWWSPAFLASLQLIPQVTILSGPVDTGETDGEGNPILIDLDPVPRTRQVIEDAGAQWGAEAAELPGSGTVTAGTIYRLEDDLWYVIQGFNRTTYGAHPSTYPALIRRIRNPYAVEEWTQPLDQFDSFHLVNPFTGQPDRTIRNGQEWYVTGANGAGLNNWPPGEFGWTVVGQEPEPGETWVDTNVTITQLVAAGIYRVSGIPTLAFDQSIRLGDAETVFKGYWPTIGTPSDYLQIAPHVSAAVGSKVWAWE